MYAEHHSGLSTQDSGLRTLLFVRPMSRSRFGLRWKFITAFAGLTIVIALLIVSIEQYRVRRSMTQTTIDQAAAIANTIESTAGYYVLFGLTDDLHKIVDDLAKNAAVSYTDFTDASGKVLAANVKEVPPEVASPGLGNPRANADVRAAKGEPMHLFVVPFFETHDANAKPKGYFRLLVNERQAQ